MLEQILKTLKIVFALCGNPTFTLMFWVQTGVISGKNGVLKTGNTTYGSATDFEIKNWSVEKSGSAIPTIDSSVTDGSTPKVVGKYTDEKGSFTAIHRFADTNLEVNTAYDAHLVEDDVSGDEVYWSGNIIITRRGIETPIDDNGAVVAVDYDFEVNGKLTLTDDSSA